MFFFLKNKNLKIIVDTLAVNFIYLAVVFFIKPDDPFFVKSDLNFFTIVLALVSLFHGFIASIITMLIFMVISIVSYLNQFPIYHFLWYLVLALIFSEAHYLWSNKNKKLEKELDYLMEKVRNLRENLFILKISHDQIEKNYVLKPMSIRNALNEISIMIKERNMEVFKNFLRILSKYTGIESASLYIRKEDEFIEVAYVGDSTDLDLEDQMVKEALEKKEGAILSIASLKDNTYSKYLAVVPSYDENQELNGLLTVSEIPFSNLNKDNLLQINVFLIYLFGKLKIAKNYEEILQKYVNIDMYLVREIDILIALYKKYKIESNVVVFYMDVDEFIGGVFIEIESKIRGFDYAVRYRFGDKELLIVLLPFTSDANVRGFIDRVRRDIKRLFGRDTDLALLHRIIPVGKYTLEKTLYKIVKS